MINKSSSDSKGSESDPYQQPYQIKPSRRYQSYEQIKPVGHFKAPLRLSNTLPMKILDNSNRNSNSVDHLLKSSNSTKMMNNRQYPFMPLGKQYNASCEKDFRNVKRLMDTVNNNEDGIM